MRSDSATSRRDLLLNSGVGLVLTVAGLAVASYLTLAHYNTHVVLACSDTGVVNCAKVTSSAQSELFGVPVALLGLLFFAALLPLQLPRAWARPPRGVPALRLAMLAVGIVFVVYLVYTELITLRALCLYCTAVHVLTVLLFAHAALITALQPPGNSAADADDDLPRAHDAAGSAQPVGTARR